MRLQRNISSMQIRSWRKPRSNGNWQRPQKKKQTNQPCCQKAGPMEEPEQGQGRIQITASITASNLRPRLTGQRMKLTGLVSIRRLQLLTFIWM
nr:MAG TPA: hypothetical protein [Caudoviricetes sp.]